MKESQVLAKVLQRIRAEDQSHARKVHGGPYSQAGEPDVDGCVRGRAVKIEVKAPGKKPTGLQMRCLRRWEEAGALSGWADCEEDIEELMSHVDDVSWRNPQLRRPVS